MIVTQMEGICFAFLSKFVSLLLMVDRVAQVAKLLDSKKKNCLTIARERGNHRCVEILAPLFGYTILEEGLLDGARNEQEAILFLDFDLPDASDHTLNVALAPPEEFLKWLEFDGLSWLISDDVSSRTYAADDVWITVAKGNEVVRVESMSRDLVWDATWQRNICITGLAKPGLCVICKL